MVELMRWYGCEADNCDVLMESPFITVEYWLVDEDDEDLLEDAHFCSWVCHAAWAVNQAMTAQG